MAADSAAQPVIAPPSALRVLRARGRVRGVAALLGPAFVAAVAYIDPGNFATNFSAGAVSGYALAWAIVAANLMAMLVQYLSAKVGIATGRDLPELCRDHLPRPVSLGLWLQAELIAMATDLAEFVGAAIGLNLLFGVPLLAAGLITAVVAFAILALEQRGYRKFELAIAALLGIVFLGFVYDLAVVGGSPSGIAGGLVPSLAGPESLLLVTGIIGATVMPHAVYLHSALTQARTPVRGDAETGQVLRFSNQEVVVALAVAGLVNMAMVMMASSAFHAGHSDVAEIETAYHTLTPLLGGAASALFLLSLIASGISSSTVGTMAGQMIMQGFVGFRIPIAVRRLVTMAPALVVVALGVNATKALVISQVVLSIALPLPMIALLMFTRRPDIMGAFANGRTTNVAALSGTAVVLALNVFLILQTLGIPIPGLS